MIKISLCMIVKDEEQVLNRCLTSVEGIADEIIIVDTGSTDKTKDIAKKFTDKIYDFKWVNDFSKARNYSFSKATMDYTLWLDADDVILEEDREKFLKLKEELNPNTDIVMMKYNVGFDENGNVNFSYYRERLLKTKRNYIWKSPIHEVIEPVGNIFYSDICITHKKEKEAYSRRNLDIFEDMLSKNIKLDYRQQYYYARELMYNKEYEKAINNLTLFIKEDGAWIENKINACLDLANCYLQINKEDMYLPSLFKSFEFDTPRAEICTTIGLYFLSKSKYNLAIYWLKLSTQIAPNLKSGAFVLLDYYNFIPYINLCVCYDRLGDLKKAYEYNELAGKFKPESKEYINNKKYFEKALTNLVQ